MKTVAVLLTVHNRKEKTIRCISETFSQRLPKDVKLNVFMTDDGCTDGTSLAVLERFPDVTIIEGDGSLFWNRGMRAAWREASKCTPDFYLWLNDDTVLKENAIQTMLESSHKENDSSIIVGTTQASLDDDTITYGGRTLDCPKRVVSPLEKESISCDFFNGNIVLIPKNVFDKVGFNDGFYRHSFGDFDYGHAARKAGIKSLVAPGVLGYCQRNSPIPLYQRDCYGLIKRFKLLYSPLGMNPVEDFHYQRKFHGMMYSFCHVVKLHINVFLTKRLET